MVCEDTDFVVFPNLFNELFIFVISSVQTHETGVIPAFPDGCKGKLHTANARNDGASLPSHLPDNHPGITEETGVAAYEHHNLFRAAPLGDLLYQDAVILFQDNPFRIDTREKFQQAPASYEDIGLFYVIQGLGGDIRL